MNKLPFLARILLGAIFLMSGLNGFFNFMPMPAMPDQAGAFLGALASSGYFFPFLKIMETLCGALLLLDVYVPLALVILAPIVTNILLFHLFLAPGGIYLPIVIAVLLAYLSFFSDPYSHFVKKIFRNPTKEMLGMKKMKSIRVS